MTEPKTIEGRFRKVHRDLVELVQDARAEGDNHLADIARRAQREFETPPFEGVIEAEKARAESR